MAMRAVRDLPKFTALKKELGIGYSAAIGLLEGMWHMTARVSPRGDLGKHTDQEIYDWIEWGVDHPGHQPEQVIAALVKHRWLDRHPAYRLCVHDWHHHADSSVKATLRNRKLTFVQDEPDYAKLTQTPEKSSGAPGCGSGEPERGPGAPELAKSEPRTPDKYVYVSGYVSGSGAGAVCRSPAGELGDARTHAEPIDESYFTGKPANAPPAREEPVKPLAGFPVQVHDEAERIVDRFVRRRYGTEANIPGTYRRTKDVFECAQVLEFHADAAAKLNRYFDKPTLQGNAAFYQILKTIGLDAQVENKRAPPSSFDLAGAVDQVLKRSVV